MGRDSSTVSIHDKSTITDSLIIPVQETNGNEFLETENRLPQLLRDVKVLLTDALIADVWKDTLEVIYTLDRIFDLLTEYIEDKKVIQMTKNNNIQVFR